MRNLLRPLAAESIGTLLFVFLGAGCVVVNGATMGGIGALGVALVHGVGMAVIVSATMSISGGHINPAVTFGVWIARKIDGRTATGYVVAQLVGALVGALLVKALLPATGFRATLGGTPQLGVNVTFLDGIVIEAILTFFLVSAVFGTAISPQAPNIGGFGIGLAIFVDATMGSSLTGAMMNPARALGPAVVAGDLHGQAVYWIGPLVGGAVAGILWKAVLPKTS